MNFQVITSTYRHDTMEKVLDKTFKIIDVLLQSKGPKGVTELAGELGLVKSNVHRLLNSLIELQLVRQVPGGEKYELTLKLWHMGNMVLSKTDVRGIAEGYMHKLCQLSHEDVFLSALEGSNILYIHKVKSAHVVRATFGSVNPAYCSATGKAILAWSPIEKVDECLKEAKPFTELTICTKEEFLKELEHIRQCGYSINKGEWRLSVRGVAAPIFNHEGRCVAAISISGPAHRLSLSCLEELAPMVCSSAAEISACMGYQPAQVIGL